MDVRSAVFGALLSLTATGALASTVTLSAQNPANIFGSNGNSSVSINSSSPNVNINARAGGFSVTDGINDFVAWCLDITHVLSLPSTYQETSSPFSNTGVISAARMSNIQKLFNVNYSTLALGVAAQSAGFQLALWELLYETGSSFNVGTGSFKVSSNTATVNAANGFLASLGANSVQTYKLTFYESKKTKYTNYSQNLVSATPVPLPAGLPLLGAGILVLGLIGRRKREDLARFQADPVAL